MKNIAKLYMRIMDTGANMSLVYSFIEGAMPVSTYTGQVVDLDTSRINGNVIIELELQVDGDYEPQPDGWVKIYRVWGEE